LWRCKKKAEEIRVAEIQRIHNRLGTLSAEQLAAVEALTRGLVNKFLHSPMQALKQAARDGDESRLEALCDEWSVSPTASTEAQPADEPAAKAEPESPDAGNSESKRVVNMRVFEGEMRARK
jgi:glutamyl-tRNA reductase